MNYLLESSKRLQWNSPNITHIFQQSYNTSKLPDDWLQPLITPIHKKSLKSDPANYRPISLTCILCKVVEHIILGNMWKHTKTTSSSTSNMVSSQGCLVSPNSSRQSMTG